MILGMNTVMMCGEVRSGGFYNSGLGFAMEMKQAKLS